MNTDKFTIPIAIIIAGGLIAGALYYSNINLGKDSKKVAIKQELSNVDIRSVGPTDHILGDPKAKIIIVEYSDTECPYCKVFHNVLKSIISEYGKSGKVAWVYRHFPIDELHSKSRKEAEATECVNELGGGAKFWEYLNMIYENTPSDNELDPAQLPVFAKQIGINVNDFNACLSDGTYSKKVDDDVKDAKKSGAQGTPHSVMILTSDGSKASLEGAYTYSQLKLAIEALLQ